MDEEKLERLRAENAVLRARAVPHLDWKPIEGGFWCVVGSMVFNVQNTQQEGNFWRWTVHAEPDTEIIDICASRRRKPCASPEEAKSQCEAAFLRLVGISNG
jgi:hypothetical protein